MGKPTSRRRTEPESRLAKLYALLAALDKSALDAKNAGKRAASSSTAAKAAAPKLSAADAKVAAIAKMRSLGGIKKKEDAITKYKRRGSSKRAGPAAASNDYKRPSSRKVIPSTRPRNQTAIAASRASLYGNFAKSTDPVATAATAAVEQYRPTPPIAAADTPALEATPAKGAAVPISSTGRAAVVYDDLDDDF